mmetsp:Transcript_18009/g.25394  ORF Transcript_18009/g.25394 Transcript_18009/m.25394 type:complete len:303 (+) Transcript_18009:243-1151(+)
MITDMDQPAKKRRIDATTERETETQSTSKVNENLFSISSLDRDRIEIHVGDTKFVTARTTLISGSTYFQSLLSVRWNQNEEKKEPLFLDQEPGPFEILLRYMRTGLVQLPQDDFRLCNLTLTLAEFLGMTSFLVEIKSTAKKRICHENDFEYNQEKDAARFDELYGSLKACITKGILPKCYFEPCDILQICVQNRIIKAPKPLLVKNSIYFRELLGPSNPVNYWKESHTMIENSEVLELTLQFICHQTFNSVLYSDLVRKFADGGGTTPKALIGHIRTCTGYLGISEDACESVLRRMHEADD